MQIKSVAAPAAGNTRIRDFSATFAPVAFIPATAAAQLGIVQTLPVHVGERRTRRRRRRRKFAEGVMGVEELLDVLPRGSRGGSGGGGDGNSQSKFNFATPSLLR